MRARRSTHRADAVNRARFNGPYAFRELMEGLKRRRVGGVVTCPKGAAFSGTQFVPAWAGPRLRARIERTLHGGRPET